MSNRYRRRPTSRDRSFRHSTSRRMLLESLEPKRLLAAVPIDAEQQQTLVGGVSALVGFGDRLENAPQLSAAIPLLGDNVGQLLNISDVLDQTLGNPISSYLESQLEPNSDGLAEAIRLALAGELADGLQIQGQGDVEVLADDSDLSLQLSYGVQRTVTREFDLATALETAAVHVDTSLSVPIQLNFQIDAVISVETVEGSSDKAFSIHFGDASQITATATFSQLTGDTIPARQGLLGLDVQGAALLYEMGLDLIFSGTSATASDLVSTPVADLVALQPAAASSNTFELSLPLSTDFDGVLLSPDASFVLHDSQLFDNRFDVADPQYVSNGVENQNAFGNLSPAELFGLFKQVGSLLGDAGNSPAFQRDIPLTDGKTLSDVLDLGEAFAREVTDLLGSDSSDGGTQFATAQELAARLAETVRYIDDPAAGPTLIFDIGLEHRFDAATVPLSFGFDLGALSGISASSDTDLSLEAEVAIDLSVGVLLRKPGAEFALTNATPVSDLNRGQGVEFLSGQDDLEFLLRDGTRFTVDLFGAAAVGNVITRIHDAARNAGLVVPGDPGMPQFAVSIDSDKKGLQILDTTSGEGELRVGKVGDSLALFGLGISGTFPDGQLAGRPLHGRTVAENLFLQETASPMVTAVVRLLADDIDAGANLGPVSLQIVDGTGVGQLQAQLSLGDPGDDTFDEHLTASEISGALADASLRLVAQDEVQFADRAASEYGGALSISILESDGSTQEFLVPFQVRATSSDAQDRIEAIVTQISDALQQMPGGARILVDHTGERLTFSLTDGVARQLRVAPATTGDAAAAAKLGVTQTLSGYVMRPKLTGFADFDFPLHVSIGGPQIPGGLNVGGIALPAIPNLAVSIPDFAQDDFAGPGAVDMDLGALGDLLQLRNLPLSTVIFALRGGLDYLRQLEGLQDLAFFNQDLPLLGINLNETLNVADAFGDLIVRLESNPAEGLGQLDELLEDALDIPEDPTGTDPEVPDFAVSTIPELNRGKSFVVNGNTIDLSDRAGYNPNDIPGNFTTLESFLYFLQRDSDKIEVSYDKSVGEALRFDIAFDIASVDAEAPIEVDLESLGVPGLTDFVDMTGGSLVHLSAGAAVQLSIGIDLTHPDGIRTFLYDLTDDGNGAFAGTRLELTSSANADNIEFMTTVGPLGVEIHEGTLVVSNSAGSGPATMALGLKDTDQDGRHYLDDFTGANAAGIGMDDLIVQTSGRAEAQLPVTFPGLDVIPGVTQPSLLTVTAADLTDFSNVTIEGGGVFETARNLLSGDFDLGAMVGGWEGAFDLLIDAMNGQLFGIPLPLVGDALKDEARFLQDIKQSVVDNLQSSTDQAARDVQSAIFDALGPGGLDLLVDETSPANDGVPDGQVTIHDVISQRDPSGNGRYFRIHLGQDPLTLDVPIDFDLGVPGLSLDVNAPVQVALGYDFVFGVGVNLEDGFYVDTSDPSELEVFLDVTVPGLSAEGQLGFLQVHVDDRPTARALVGKDGPLSSQFLLIGNEVSTDLEAVAISFVNDPSLAPGEETVVFDPLAKTLVFTINAEFVTAAALVKLVNQDAVVSTRFTAELPFGGSGAGLVDPRTTATTMADLPSRFQGKFEANITDPSGDGRLTLGEMFRVRLVW